MNQVNLIGRLVRDPEIRYTQGENSLAIATFSLAINRPKRGEEQLADYINCKGFGKIADNIGNFLHQGDKIAVQGSIQTGNYTNKNGQKVYTTEIVINGFPEFLEIRSNSANRPNYEMGENDLSQGGYQVESSMPKHDRPSRAPVDTMSQRQVWKPGDKHQTEGEILANRKPMPPLSGNRRQAQQPKQDFEEFLTIPEGFGEDEGLPFN